MGQFANTLFRMLLGWVQTAASWLWSLVTDTNVSEWLRWLLDNWLPLTLWLCLGGLVIDFIVYLLRWQPYRVWRSFLRRRTEDEESSADAIEPSFQRTWVYADGTTQVENVRESLRAPAVDPEPQLEQPIRPTRRMARRATPEQSYHEPVYPPQWQHDKQGEHQ